MQKSAVGMSALEFDIFQEVAPQLRGMGYAKDG